jgi:hypothetical protein
MTEDLEMVNTDIKGYGDKIVVDFLTFLKGRSFQFVVMIMFPESWSAIGRKIVHIYLDTK